MTRKNIWKYFSWLKNDDSAIPKTNITETKQLLPDGKRMTVYSLIRFNVTKADDNTTVICETKNDAATARASMLLVVKYAPEVSISTDPKDIYEGRVILLK